MKMISSIKCNGLLAGVRVWVCACVSRSKSRGVLVATFQSAVSRLS